MLALPQHSRQSVNIWPGFVDALASVLLVLIFTLLIYVLAQFFLSTQLSDKDLALKQLSRAVHELSDALSLEREHSAQLSQTMDELTVRLNATVTARDALQLRLTEMIQRAETAENQSTQLRLDMDELRKNASVDKEKIRLQLMEIASLQEDLHTLRQVRAQLENEIAALAAGIKQRDEELTAIRDRNQALEARLADEQERTRLAQRVIEKRKIRIQELTAQIANVDRAMREQQALSDKAQSQVTRLTQQILALREQLTGLSAALELAETQAKSQQLKIAELSQQLNTALAQKVEELSRYRSEFFGRLREVLGKRPDIRIQGDRFVFPSELLFESASAELGPQGRQQLVQLAETLKSVAKTIPADIEWILRIDGHTDRRPIRTVQFPSNWELSTGRALAITKFLVQQGIPPHRLVAAGFGEFHPLDIAETPESYRRNRRIEIKLTSR